MGTQSTKANMKTSQLALTLVLLGLQGSKAGKVASCLTCAGALESDCAAGTGKGKACPANMAAGCYVAAVTAEANGQSVTTFTRGCCFTPATNSTNQPGSCSDFHEDMSQNGVSGRIDQTWCDTDDCNTMDPRTGGSSAGTLVPSLTFFLTAVAVMASNNF